MALAKDINCDDEMVETLRIAINKIPPRDLEAYALSTPGFAKGGFRNNNIQLIRTRIISMITSKEPIDNKLRSLLRDQIRRSLEAGGGNVAIKKELETLREENTRLKAFSDKYEKESRLRKELESSLKFAKAELEETQKENRSYRARYEKLESDHKKIIEGEKQHIDAVVQTRLSKEMAKFFAGKSPLAEENAIDPQTQTGRLVSAIRNSPERDLSMWNVIIKTIAQAGAISKESREQIESEIRRRYTSIHMQNFESRLPKDGELTTPTGIFHNALAGKIPAILLIDAHNTLFALQARYRLPNEHRYPTAQTRQWLVEDLIKLLENAPNVRAYIVFDGPERTQKLVSPNVEVIYSGGTGEHRADGVLIDQAHFLKDAGAENLLIITNDGGLYGEASRHGTRNLAPTALLNVL